MKYCKDGRTYRLGDGGVCSKCAFRTGHGFPHGCSASTELRRACNSKWDQHFERETLWSKIRNWRKH